MKKKRKISQVPLWQFLVATCDIQERKKNATGILFVSVNPDGTYNQIIMSDIIRVEDFN